MIMPLVGKQINENIKVALTVSLVARLLLDGKSQADIARACNINRSAVTNYIKRHYDELIVLVDPTHKHLALKSKSIANRAINKVDNILSSEQFTKKDLLALNVTAGTQIDKFRLLQGESTSIVSISATNKDIKELDNQQALIEAKIRELSGDVDG